MTDHFSLYQLPVSFHPDAAVVKQKYYELSRQYHPDRAGNATSESMMATAQVNEAFRVFRSADATMEYILKLNNLIEDQEKYSLPPDFLMEMMDLNEALGDLEPGDEAALAQAKQELEARFSDWQQDVDKLTAMFDGGDRNPAWLLEIKDFYFRKKYLLRIKERIDKFAAH